MLFAEQVNVLWLVQVLRAIGGSLEGRSHFSVVTFVFVILGLLDGEPLRRHLRRLGDGTVGATAIGIISISTADNRLRKSGSLDSTFGARWLLLEDRPAGLEISQNCKARSRGRKVL